MGSGQTNIITTIAGNGNLGFSGDGGLATQADIGWAAGLATDNIGNVYFDNGTEHRIRKIDTNGIITTIMGTGTAGFSGDGGPATLAQANWPGWPEVDKNGNLYFSDVYNHRIRKIDTAGIISTVVGNGVDSMTGDGGLAINASVRGPQKIAFDSKGNYYFFDAGNNSARI